MATKPNKKAKKRQGSKLSKHPHLAPFTQKEQKALLGEPDLCDGCNQPIDRYLSYHIGTYAEEVEQNYTSYYCKPCFVREVGVRLVSIAAQMNKGV